ncbi:MAG: MCE family protein [Myxococcales bacterium]|nr:MCE family protein [Myxococcales bacterium]
MRRNLIALAIFVVVCLGLLAGLASELGVFGGRGNTYKVRLDDAGGLVPGNSVRIAGVEVGRITSIGLVDNQALIELRLDPKVTLYDGNCAKPRPKSLLGEKYLHLDQGSSATGSPLAPGSEILCTRRMVDVSDALEGLAPILQSDEAVYPILIKMLKRLDKLTSGLDGPGGDAGAAGAGEAGEAGEADAGPTTFAGAMTGLGGLIDESRGAAAAGRLVIEENREDIRAIVQASRALATDPRLSRAIGNLEAMSRDGRETLAKLDKIADRADALFARIDKELGPDRFKQVDGMLDDGRVAVANLREASESLKGMGKSTSTLLDTLLIIAKRAASLSEKDIRKFFQEEGMRVRVLPDRDVRRRINELDGAGE